ELVVGFMIDLSRRVTPHAVAYHAGNIPQAVMGRELRGSTLGVIGYGAIGRELARVAGELGMRVLICDPYVSGTKTVSMEKLLAASDYVVPLAVATAETENLINDAAFAAMKDGALFINVSRGNLVDEAALVR